jgi:peptide-methionine (R)-S-oxide reductase
MKHPTIRTLFIRASALTATLSLLVFIGACASQKEKTMSKPPKTPPHSAIQKSDAEWKSKLDPMAYNVLRQCGTEPPFTGAFWDHHESGVYSCAGCEAPLFTSKAKFDSGTGWPSFWDALDAKAIRRIEDRSLGMVRIEIRCSKCDGHLGHLFDDGPKPTGQRYCINSASLKFEKRP